MGSTSSRHEWSLPRDPASCEQARDLVSSAASSAGSPEELEDLLLLVSELVSNAIRHGESFDDGTILLRVDVGRDLVRLAVADAGRRFDWVSRVHPRGEVGGYGLDLIDHLSSSWGTSTDGVKAVWCEIAMQGGRGSGLDG
jgi:anti-sigma regulatory factor (Ser/Thr protein kinase)